MGLTAFNRARREAAARAEEVEPETVAAEAVLEPVPAAAEPSAAPPVPVPEPEPEPVRQVQEHDADRRAQLEKLKRDDLFALAKQSGASVRPPIRNEQIIDAILAAEQEQPDDEAA